jgi:hypothetical protein
MNEINQWLNGSRDYSKGVALYVKYGNSYNFKKLLLSDRLLTPTVMESLAYELNKIKDTVKDRPDSNLNPWDQNRNELIAWLNGPRNYWEGVDLYIKYGQSEFLKKNLTHVENEYNKQTLVHELNRIKDKLPEVTPRKIIKRGRPKKTETREYSASNLKYNNIRYERNY